MKRLIRHHRDTENSERRQAVSGEKHPGPAVAEDRGNFLLRLAWALLLAKEGKDATAELDESVRRWATINPSATCWVADVYGELGQTEAALEWLAKAVQNGDPRVAWFRWDPHLKDIRKDPRFDTILAAAASGNR